MNPATKKNRTKKPNHPQPQKNLHNLTPTKNPLQHSSAVIVEDAVVSSLSLQGFLCNSAVCGGLLSLGWGEISSVYQLSFSKQRPATAGCVGEFLAVLMDFIACMLGRVCFCLECLLSTVSVWQRSLSSVRCRVLQGLTCLFHRNILFSGYVKIL